MAFTLNSILPAELCAQIDRTAEELNIEDARYEHEEWFRSQCLAEMMFIAKLDHDDCDNYDEDGILVCGVDHDRADGCYFGSAEILRKKITGAMAEYAEDTYDIYAMQIEEYDLCFN